MDLSAPSMRGFVIAIFVAMLARPQHLRGQERVIIPVAQPATRGPSMPLYLEAFVHRPPGAGPFPVVVVNHGSAAGDPKQTLPASVLADYFVARKMVVVVPMRRGRGQSQGTSLESEDRNCDLTSWAPGLAAAFEDLTGAIDYARRLPGIDSTRVFLAGVSRGGFLSVAYAAQGVRRASVVAVVNFVGAWVAQREDRCPRDYNAVSFKAFGAETSVPMLWLYGDRDPYNATPDIIGYSRDFRNAGGRLHFVLFPRVPESGHALADHPALWRDTVSRFLDSVRAK